MYVNSISLLALLFLTSACLNLDSLSGNSSNTNQKVSGVASKGIISGATANIYSIGSDGKKDKLLGSAITNNKGEYNIDLGSHNGPIIVEVVGGEYTDEATRQRVTNTKLRAVVSKVAEDTKVAVTPLTEIAVQIAGDNLNADKIDSSNAAVSVLIGGADITSTLPVDIDEDLNQVSEAQRDYTVVLAAVSQMVEDGSVSDVQEAITNLSSDLKDDGQLSTVENAPGRQFVSAINNFVESPENNTGLKKEDVSVDDKIEAASKVFLLSKREIDWDGDGALDEIHTYEYDSNGNKIAHHSDGDYGDDELPNGSVDFSTYYTYNSNNQETKIEKSYNADGVINHITYKTYNAQNLIESHKVDSNVDGTMDAITTYHYEDSKLKRTEHDYDADGAINHIIHKTWVDGKLSKEEHDTAPVDGSIDYYYEYSYYDNGDKKLVRYRKLSSPANNSDSHYQWNAFGKVSLSGMDKDLDGNLDLAHTYFYDSKGRLTHSTYDGNGLQLDGVIDAKSTYTHDSDGNILTEEEDNNGDSVVNYKVTFTWQEKSAPSYTVVDNAVFLPSQITACQNTKKRFMAVDRQEKDQDLAYEVCIESNILIPSNMPVCSIGSYPTYVFDFEKPDTFKDGVWECFTSQNVMDYIKVNSLFTVSNNTERSNCISANNKVVFNPYTNQLYCSDDSRIPLHSSTNMVCPPHSNSYVVYQIGNGFNDWTCRMY